MTRTESEGPIDREALKREIKAELKHEAFRNKILSCLVTLLISVVVVSVPVVAVAVALAKTGFVEVPVLSEKLYRSSEPVRVVTPLKGSKPNDVLSSVALRMKFDPKIDAASLRISEQELTTLVMDGVASARETLPFPVRTIQIALQPDAAEIFLVSPQPKRDVTVRIRMAPAVKDGKLKLPIKEVKIGSLVVPTSIANVFSSFYEKMISDSFEKTVSQMGSLTEIALEQGYLKLVIRPRGL